MHRAESAFICGHGPSVNAACAVRTAWSASCALPRAISAHGSPVKGLKLSNHWLEAGATHSPPMYI